jgi:hypothetical protein
MEITEIRCFSIRNDSDPEDLAGSINEQLKKLGISANNVISITPPTDRNPETMRVFYRHTYLARR